MAYLITILLGKFVLRHNKNKAKQKGFEFR